MLVPYRGLSTFVVEHSRSYICSVYETPDHFNTLAETGATKIWKSARDVKGFFIPLHRTEQQMCQIVETHFWLEAQLLSYIFRVFLQPETSLPFQNLRISVAVLLSFKQ